MGPPGSSGVPPGWHNVKEFGAVGDGVTDDTAALQAALVTTTTASDRGTLYLPPGNYVHKGLMVNGLHGWSIRGAAPNSAFQSGPSRLRYTGAGSILVQFVGTLANTNVGGITINTSGLTGSGITRTVIAGTGSRNEKQEIAIYATGGTYTLTFGANTTSPIAYNASPATVQTALQGLASIGSGNATCTNDVGAALRIAGCSGFELVDVGFDYSDVNAFHGYVIFVDGTGADCQNWKIHRCGTKALGTFSARGGLRMYRSIIASVDRCQFNGADYQLIFGADDVNMDSQYSNGVDIGNCTFNGSNGGAHICISDGDVEQLEIHDCTFEAGTNTGGIKGLPQTNQIYSMTIRNNWFGDASGQTVWIDGLYAVRGPIVIANNFFGDVHTGGSMIKIGWSDGTNNGGIYHVEGNICNSNSTSYVFDQYGATNIQVVSIGNAWFGPTNFWNTTSFAIPDKYWTFGSSDVHDIHRAPIAPGGDPAVATPAGQKESPFSIGLFGGTTNVLATLPANRCAVYVNQTSGGGRRVAIQGAPTNGGVALSGGSATNPVVETLNNQLGFYGVTPVSQAARAGQLTDSTGGSVSGTLAAGITDAVAKNAIASLAAKVNALETIIHNLGLSA